jgi:hypothetical protein
MLSVERADDAFLTWWQAGRESAAQARKPQLLEADMPLVFVGIDPKTEQGDSPTVWIDTDKQELMIQGWKATTEEEDRCYSEGGTAPGHAEGVPNHEAIVRIPIRMAPTIRKALDALERPVDR